MPAKRHLSLKNVPKHLGDVPEVKEFAEQEIERIQRKELVEQLPSAKYFELGESPGKFIPKYLAEDIMAENSFVTLIDTAETFWFDETEGIWRANGETLIKEKCTQLLGDFTRKNHVAETLDYIKNVSFRDRKIFDNSNINLLPLQNGVLDLATMQLLPYSPEYFFISKMPMFYNPDADCPQIKKFFSEIVNSDDISLLEELPAYCLHKGYPIQKAVMVVGDGANGKSTYLYLLTTFLGSENVSSVSLQDLERNRFASSGLYKKMANVYADLPTAALSNPGLFKMLTGGDLITAEKKFKNPFQFLNYAKLIFSANQVPYVKDESSAFFRRWIIINFPNKFENDRADKNLLQKLATEQELSGLLNLCLKKLPSLLTNGFSYAKTTEEIREAYVRASDPIGSFCFDCVVASPEDFMEKEQLYNAYSNFCREKKMPVKDKSTFSKQLRLYVQVEDCRPTVEGKRVTAWKGIRIIPHDVNPVNPVNPISPIKVFTDTKKLKIENNPDTSDTPDSNKCYRCKSETDLTEVEDFITHEPIWICSACQRELAG